MALFERIAREFVARLDADQLNYGDYAGDPRFLETLARFLSDKYRVAVDPAALFLTAGASHAIDTVCRLHCVPGDVVLVEEPTYFLALEVFASQGLRVVSVAMDDEGLRPDALRDALAAYPNAKLLYTIPVHHNPTSVTMSAQRRRDVLTLTRAAGVTVLADEVYQLLHFEPDRPAPLPFAAEISGGGVISVGSFSKLLAPAMRVGWVQGDARTVERLCAMGMFRSGGAINQVGSMVVRAAIESGELQAHLEQHLVPTLRARSRLMGECLAAGLSSGAVRWKPVHGGYFYWLSLPEHVDSTQLLAMARAAGVGFHPGQRFSAVDGQRAALRLSFARYDEQAIEAGMRRLTSLLASAG